MRPVCRGRWLQILRLPRLLCPIICLPSARACDGTSRSSTDWHRGARNGSSCSWTWVTRRPQPLFGDWGKGSLPGAYCALVRFSSSASIAASILPLTAFSRARTSASGSRSKSLTRPARYSSRSSSKVPTEANGWRSTVRRSIARLVPQPGQKTSSHGPRRSCCGIQRRASGMTVRKSTA
jgi:hypothetical protein